MQLNKYLALCGFSSRRKAVLPIQQGRVRVNDRVVTELGTEIDPHSDKIYLDGRQLVPPQSYRYILLNKPMGAITSAEDGRGRRTVLDCVDVEERIFPVGRLDYDTEGVLLLTNDGDFAYRLTHPKFGVEKVYEARVDGCVRQSAVDSLKKGVSIGEDVVVKGEAEILEKKEDETLIRIRVHEGKKRQIKRMMKSVGHPVSHLTRTRFGDMAVGRLAAGEWRDLTDREVARLYKLTGLKKLFSGREDKDTVLSSDQEAMTI